MFTSPRWHILHNPRCGAVNFAQWAGGVFYKVLVGCASSRAIEHPTPTQIRARMSAEEWHAKPILCPVRDPVQRFRSAWEEYGRQGTHAISVEKTIAMLRDLPATEWPVLYRPQAHWLSCKIDVILPLQDFANFANVNHNGKSMPWRMHYPYVGVRRVSAEIEKAIRELYRQDYALFEKLPMWPSSGDLIYTFFGRCRSCERLRQKRLGAG
jgi:hypothetical protein